MGSARVKILILILGALFIFEEINVQQREFIREYYYRASDTDSKVTSRQKALTEVKNILIEELGVYIESYANYQIREENHQITHDFFEREIRTVSAGITETIILEESWNGYEYYIKAKIMADPEEVIRRVNQALSNRRSSAVIDSLNILLTASNRDLELRNADLERSRTELRRRNAELQRVQGQLRQQQEEIRQSERALNELNQQLANARAELERQQAQRNQISSELQRIENSIRTATASAVNNIRLGMTRSEVEQVAGRPRSTASHLNNLFLNYGNYWVFLEHGVVASVFPANRFEGPLTRYVNGYKSANIAPSVN